MIRLLATNRRIVRLFIYRYSILRLLSYDPLEDSSEMDSEIEESDIDGGDEPFIDSDDSVFGRPWMSDGSMGEEEVEKGEDLQANGSMETPRVDSEQQGYNVIIPEPRQLHNDGTFFRNVSHERRRIENRRNNETCGKFWDEPEQPGPPSGSCQNAQDVVAPRPGKFRK